MREMVKTDIPWMPEISSDFSVGYVKQYFFVSKDLSNDGEPERVLKLARAGIVEKDVTTNEGQMAASYAGYNKVCVGDLLLNPMDLYSGANCNVSELNGVISPAYSNLRAKKTGTVVPKYYDYYFKSQYWLMAMFAHGKGVSFDNRWTLNNDALRSYEIPVAPYATQQKIVDAIQDGEKKVDSLIANVQAQIEKLKAYKQSLITEVVTKGLDPNAPMKDSGIEWIGKIPDSWNVSRIKYISDFGPTCDASKLTNDSIITYTPMECIKNGYFEPRSANYGALSHSLTAFQDGDIVLAKVTPCFENGNIAIMSDLDSNYGLGSSELFVLRPRTIHTRYFFYWLQNRYFLERGRATMTGTGGLKRVSPTFVKGCYIHIPPRPEQEKIADVLDTKCAQINRFISLKESKIEKLQQYKRSLIYEYVTGKKEVV